MLYVAEGLDRSVCSSGGLEVLENLRRGYCREVKDNGMIQ